MKEAISKEIKSIEKELLEFVGVENAFKPPTGFIDSRFKDKNLLSHILVELSKKHLEDNHLKMTTFLVAVSGLLKNSKRRMSIALKGDSAVGKDNLIKTVLEHVPKEAFIFLTNATQASLEDDLVGKRIIAFSELNASRDDGANKHLVEVIKQKTEGGTYALKKDLRKGMKESRYEISEQSTILYGTTELEKDVEMNTRMIEGDVKSSESKIYKVNANTLDSFSQKDKLVESSLEEDTWIRKGLSDFYSVSPQFEVIIPYASYLKEQINGKSIFDNTSPRSQRDLKRILSLTCAMTYLFQLQRESSDYKGKMLLISEPEDFINTLNFSAEFFNQSYGGIDGRLLDVLNLMPKSPTEWIARDVLQEKLNLSRNTIKHYCGLLAGQGCLEGVKGSELNETFGLKTHHQNKIYYKMCQKGVNKPLIRCQISELKLFLEEKTQKHIDTFYNIDFINYIDDKEENKEKERCQKEGVKKEIESDKTLKKEDLSTKVVEIDTFKLTPFQPSRSPNGLI